MISFWSEKIDALWEISKAYKDKRLTIALGAGVSMGCGLPSWPKLVKDLHTEVCRLNFNSGNGAYGSFDSPKGWGGLQIAQNKITAETLNTLPLPIQSRFCKNKLGKTYTKVLQNTLFSNGFAVSETINAITKLKKLKAICTYNYDDLIEISGKNKQFVSVSGPQTTPKSKIPVYHVHGLLPSNLTKHPKGDIIFSEDEYHDLYLNFGHWSNLTQLSIFIESEIVLFIGLSFDDPNLRRLLDGAKSTKKELKLYNICKLPFDRYKFVTNTPLNPKMTELSVYEQVYKDIGVTNIWIDDYEPDIPIFLDALNSEDPVLQYTKLTREFLATKLLSKGFSGHKCSRIDCNEICVTDHNHCLYHVMGNKYIFSDYAPLPKSMNDKCSIRGCNSITSGLSDKCIRHNRVRSIIK